MKQYLVNLSSFAIEATTEEEAWTKALDYIETAKEQNRTVHLIESVQPYEEDEL